MKRTNKKAEKTSLTGQVEKFVEAQSAGLFEQPEEFVNPLLHELQRELLAPEIDLGSPEAALASIEKLNATSQKLNYYKERVSKLKNVLIQRRMNLNS